METKDQYSASTLKKLILDTIKNEMLIEPELASDDAYYEAVCRVIRRILTERYKVFNAHANSVATKKVYYMSMEFLMGRSLKNSLYNLGIQDEMSEALKSWSRTPALATAAWGGLQPATSTRWPPRTSRQWGIRSSTNSASSSSGSSTAGRPKPRTTGCRAVRSG